MAASSVPAAQLHLRVGDVGHDAAVVVHLGDDAHQIAVLVHHAVVFLHVLLGALVQRGRPGPAGGGALGHRGLLKDEVRPLLGKAQQLPVQLVLPDGVLVVPLQLFKVGHPGLELLVGLLQRVVAEGPVVPVLYPFRRGGGQAP